jgi:hypothetical protein
MARLSQMTLPGQVFTFPVAVVAPSEPVAGPKYLATGEALDIPLCEKINDTLSISNVEDQNTH